MTACDLDEAIGSAVPQADAVALPADFAILEDGGEFFQPLALDRRTAAAFALLRREGEQVGIEPQTGDDADMVADGGEEFDRRKRAVGDHDDIAIGQPAVDLQGGLTGPIEQCLGRARLTGIEAFGRSERGEEGQRHDALGPRHAHQQHGRKPAQTAGFDEVSLGGSHRVAIDAAGTDLGSPPPLDGVINTDHDRGACRHEGLDQQDQQLVRHSAGRPRRSVEDTMEGAEVGIALTPQDAQCRCYGASAGRQDDAGEQHHDVRPGWACEQIGETREPGEKAWRQRIGRGGEKMGVLHPIGRINSLNRNNLVAVRQIESPAASVLAPASPIGHIDRHDQTRSNACQDRGSVHKARRGKESGSGYLILDRRAANPVARLRPIPDTDRFELFYWSNVKGRWTTFGNLGRMKLMLESAHEIVENDPMFRIPHAQ